MTVIYQQFFTAAPGTIQISSGPIVTSIVIAPTSMSGYAMYTEAGIIYGLLVELAATWLLKAPMA
jgi:hypothetical protein